MAMIRRYHVDQGHTMNFSRKLIQSDVLQENRKQQRFTKYGVGTPVKGTPLDRLKARLVTYYSIDNLKSECFLMN